jgi:hypothetical protein
MLKHVPVGDRSIEKWVDIPIALAVLSPMPTSEPTVHGEVDIGANATPG